MRTAQEIYEEYKILPALQLHQLRVAAVAKMICDNFRREINVHDVILACLFHDMGNIIKSDLTYFSDFTKPEGLDYWQGVKDEFVKKYGEDHHAANKNIAEEIGLSERVVHLVDTIGYSKLPKILRENDWEQKVAEYADTRVGPYGALPQKERLFEGKRRFEAKRTQGSTPYYKEGAFDRLLQVALQLEQQIFGHTRLKPEDITDVAVAPPVEELRKYPVA